MTEQLHSQRSIHREACAAAVVAVAIAWSAAPALAQDPQAPETVGSIPPQTVAAGQSASLDVTAYFSDPDGDALAYAATVSDVAIATVSVSGNILTIAGGEPGMAVLTVFASDPDGLSATQRAQVMVQAPNQAPESVGTIPDLALAPGQWISLSVSSYFRDPEGEALGFSATTSNSSIAGVTVSGDVVTITQAGTGTVIVNATARDSGGLSVQQSITVAAGPDRVTPAARPEAERPAPVQPQRARPDVPAVDEAGADEQSDVRARQPDPFPPRLLAAFTASTGHTLAQGRSHASAGYLGASPLAHLGGIEDILPVAVQASHGVTDDLTVTAGSGFYYYNTDGGDSDFVPYLAPRIRAWSNERISVAFAGYLGLWLAEETVTYYAGSIGGSMEVMNGLGLHASGGMAGIAATILGETETEQFGVLAVGGDFRVTPEVGLAGEFRRVGIENGSNIVTASLQVLRAAIAGEVGLAYYLEDGAEIRPIVSLAFPF